MTGRSLGLHTESYGSLQRQQQNAAVLPIQSMPVMVRKPPKALLCTSREERHFSWIFKITGRRGLGMLFLAIISTVALFMFLTSAITKDEDTPEGSDIFLRSLQLAQTMVPNSRIMSRHYTSTLSSGEKDSNMNTKSSLLSEIHSESDGGRSVLPLAWSPHPPVVLLDGLPFRHPCEDFVFPPPPADRKRNGPRPCPVCYVSVEQAIAYMPTTPSVSPILENLTYIIEDTPVGLPPFGGYPSLKQRKDSFDIKESMCVYCGFVKGKIPGHQTGFDIDDTDLLEMEQCNGIVVASAIFGNYDIIQQPKHISEAAKRNVCFYMFVDEVTNIGIKNSRKLDDTNKVGLWRIVLVHNLPYADARRNGKVPKLLLHRIFPRARFSIWIDGKLELVVDPYQILERFLWRENVSFAISRHYRRFDVFEEAEANKAAGKYDNASIDYQIEFYKREGLTHYSLAKLPITSDVPEGCVIIREHIPITNLFTCLWFNEVDRFTSRDQLSFSTVRDKLMSKVNWSINMFMDCERRNFVVQAYHRDILKHMNTVSAAVHRPPDSTKDAFGKSPVKIARTPIRKLPMKHGREKRRRRNRGTISRDTN